MILFKILHGIRIVKILACFFSFFDSYVTYCFKCVISIRWVLKIITGKVYIMSSDQTIMMFTDTVKIWRYWGSIFLGEIILPMEVRFMDETSLLWEVYRHNCVIAGGL